MNKPDWRDASVLHPEAQAVLDTMLNHLTKQRGQARGTENTGCLYRAPAGRMCAVGCLIPNELYDTSIEASVGEIFDDRHAPHGNPHMRRVATHLSSLAPSLPSEDMRALYEEVQSFHRRRLIPKPGSCGLRRAPSTAPK